MESAAQGDVAVAFLHGWGAKLCLEPQAVLHQMSQLLCAQCILTSAGKEI